MLSFEWVNSNETLFIEHFLYGDYATQGACNFKMKLSEGHIPRDVLSIWTGWSKPPSQTPKTDGHAGGGARFHCFLVWPSHMSRHSTTRPLSWQRVHSLHRHTRVGTGGTRTRGLRFTRPTHCHLVTEPDEEEIRLISYKISLQWSLGRRDWRNVEDGGQGCCSGCFPNWRSTGIFKTLQPSLGCVGKNSFHYVEGGRSGWADWLETIEKQQELRQPKLCRRASMNTQHLQPESRPTMHRR